LDTLYEISGLGDEVGKEAASIYSYILKCLSTVNNV